MVFHRIVTMLMVAVCTHVSQAQVDNSGTYGDGLLYVPGPPGQPPLVFNIGGPDYDPDTIFCRTSGAKELDPCGDDPDAPKYCYRPRGGGSFECQSCGYIGARCCPAYYDNGEFQEGCAQSNGDAYCDDRWECVRNFQLPPGFPSFP